jgi:hypothetical protein
MSLDNAYLDAIGRMHEWCAARDLNFREQMVLILNRRMRFTPSPPPPPPAQTATVAEACAAVEARREVLKQHEVPKPEPQGLKAKGRYVRTPEQRARMADAMRRRWAALRKLDSPPATPKQ